MPLFNWNHEMDHVMSAHFWVFWATAVPLTVVTVALLSLIRHQQNWRRGRDLENGEIWYAKAD